MTAAYLGPEGSYSSVAARRVLPGSGGFPCRDFDSVFHAVETGAADYGVIPLENSIEGSVNVNLDLLIRSPLYIVDEYDLSIDNRVFSLPDAKDITTVYSHAQAYNQCRAHISALYPDAEFVPTASTTDAINKLDRHSVAIAGVFNARDGLCVSDAVSDRDHNVTRFAVISGSDRSLRPPDKISIVFEAENKPGGLIRILHLLEKYDLNMISIQSRPHKTKLGRYVFYVDVNGSVQSENAAAALSEVRAITNFYKFLGNYKAADREG